MSTETCEMQQKLEEALKRIQHLEERLSDVAEASRWKHLIARPHSWRRQLALRDRNITVGQLASTVYANKLTLQEASEALELPEEVIQEALEYYEGHKELVQKEAAEERQYLRERGYLREPEHLSRYNISKVAHAES